MLALMALPVAAQSANGNIIGYVKDSSGAAIPAVTVTAKVLDQQAVRTGHTDETGFDQLLAVLRNYLCYTMSCARR